MVGTILSKTAPPLGTIARLKVSPPSGANLYAGMTAGEKQLSDVVDIGPAAQEKVQKMRKLDAYLRIFNTALDLINGRFKRYAPQFSKVEVEYVVPEKKDLLKIDV